MPVRCQFRAAFRFCRPSSSIKIEIAVDRESSLSSEPPSHKAKEGGEKGSGRMGFPWWAGALFLNAQTVFSNWSHTWWRSAALGIWHWGRGLFHRADPRRCGVLSSCQRQLCGKQFQFSCNRPFVSLPACGITAHAQGRQLDRTLLRSVTFYQEVMTAGVLSVLEGWRKQGQ
jgi:hypothetical protein